MSLQFGSLGVFREKMWSSLVFNLSTALKETKGHLVMLSSSTTSLKLSKHDLQHKDTGNKMLFLNIHSAPIRSLGFYGT